MNKKIFFIVAIIFGVIVIGGGVASQTFFKAPIENFKVERKLEGNKQGLDLYSELKGIEKKNVEKNYTDPGLILALAFEWKSLGEVTKDSYFFEKSLEIYKMGIEKFPGNVTFYWNAGKVAELVQDYGQAEFFYKEAIRVAPTYNEPYHFLAELYEYRMKKNPEDVFQVYVDGLKVIQNDSSLFLAECSFFQRHDRKDKALECYEILSKAYPNEQLYKKTIAELKQELNKK